MTDRYIHIVSFDIPLPADYGGVIDVFYKIKALHSAGIKIILHCFEYGRSHAEELNSYCTEVHYYKRKTGLLTWMTSLPYIVKGRMNDLLVKRLKKDRYPILAEGIHCAGLLFDPELQKRQIFVRVHNVEQDYYHALATKERSFLKRFFFKTEAKRLKEFEKILGLATGILPISPKDEADYKRRYSNVHLLPAFHSGSAIRIQPGMGSYALYHGNLSVGENNEAALFLVNEVFNDIDIPLVIAGNSPSAELEQAVRVRKNTTLKTSLKNEEIFKLISNAQLNVLPTFQATGIKLKLLAALYYGRHCIVNPPMVEQTGLEPICSVCSDALQMKRRIQQLFIEPVSTAESDRRKEVMEKIYSNDENIHRFIGWVKWSL